MIETEFAEKIVQTYEEFWEFVEGKRGWDNLTDKDFARLSVLYGPKGRKIWVQDLLQGLVTASQK